MPNSNFEDKPYAQAFKTDDSIYGKQIQSVPRPQPQVGIDLDGTISQNIINAGDSSHIDIGKIESFTQVSQNRDTMYGMLDTMIEDSTISAIVETYAEDVTETNEQGKIVWCQSDNADIASYVTYLLDDINVEKNIYKWAYSLIKYGDLYLRLFHESEYSDELFADQKKDKEKEKKQQLQEAVQKIKNLQNVSDEQKEKLVEAVKLKIFSQNDPLVHYIEMVPNPAEMFELTKFGKSYAYIKAPVASNMTNNKDNLIYNTYRYTYKKKDIHIFEPNNFVHAALEDDTPRVPEEVKIFIDDKAEYDEDLDESLSYNVRRGQSLLYNSFKIWREMMLLENAMLLNRLTKSSLIRIINVEVGDMPKEMVGPHLMGIKNMVEQKSSLSTGNSFTEYTNPGPMENNIYVPTHNQMGTISMQNVGGDVNVTGLDDVNYFQNKLFGSMRVPKQYFAQTDDSAGFNGGTSLSIISSRYAKTIKRIQNVLCQTITDAINLMLLDKGMDSYINGFTIRMQEPSTQEATDRQSVIQSKIGVATDVMNLVSEIEDPSAKLRILKTLLSSTITDTEVIDIIQEKIDELEEMGAMGDGGEGSDESDAFEMGGGGMPHDLPGRSEPPMDDMGGGDMGEPPMDDLGGGEDMSASAGELPTPDSLGMDFTDNTTM